MRKRRSNRYTSVAFNVIIAAIMSLFLGTAVSLAAPVNPLWVASGIFALTVAQMFGLLAMARKPMHGMLLMAITAYGCATDTLGTAQAAYTVAGDCVDEGTGVIGFFLVKKGYNIATDITDQTTYDAAKTAKNIIPVKDVEAYWPKGTPVTIPGKAGRMERLAYVNYEMPFKFDGVFSNLHFINALNQSRNYGVCFITEDYKALCPLDRDMEPVLAAFFGLPAGEEEFHKQAEMSGTIKWKHADLPQYLDNLTNTFLKPDFQP